MLYVKIPSLANPFNPDKCHYNWHIGEEFPFKYLPRVVEIQVDGDELELILTAIKMNSKIKKD